MIPTASLMKYSLEPALTWMKCKNHTCMSILAYFLAKYLGCMLMSSLPNMCYLLNVQTVPLLVTQYLQWVSRNKLLTGTGGWRSPADGSLAIPKQRFETEQYASKKVVEKDSEDVNKEEM